MALTDVNLFRIDGTVGSTSNLQTSALNGGPLAGTRNRIINGDMRIDQRNAGASVTPTDGQYTLDRWITRVSQSSKLTVQQSSVAPAGFSNSLLVTSSSAYSIVASDFFSVSQYVEGFNFADFAWGAASAATITISFWVRSSLTGTFGGSIRNNAENRSYPFSYTIAATDTWEYKSVTIMGDTTGTWVGSTNGRGAMINWSVGTGSTFSAAANSYTAGNILSSTGATSVVGTSGATFYITGVQLEPGTVATPFERRSYGQELSLCQRYYWKTTNRALNTALDNTKVGAAVNWPTTMRAAPTIGNGSFAAGAGSAGTFSSFGATIDAGVLFNAASNWTTGAVITASFDASIEL
jgi:hypothetical protein